VTPTQCAESYITGLMLFLDTLRQASTYLRQASAALALEFGEIDDKHT